MLWCGAVEGGSAVMLFDEVNRAMEVMKTLVTGRSPETLSRKELEALEVLADMGRDAQLVVNGQKERFERMY